MATLTVELPDRLATQLAAEAGAQKQLKAFVVGAIEAWLRRQRGTGDDSQSWTGSFEESAADFVDQLIEGNRELFEELSRR